MLCDVTETLPETYQANKIGIYYIYIYLANIWSFHIHRKFLEIPTLIRENRKKNYLKFFTLTREKKKEKLSTTIIIKNRLKYLTNIWSSHVHRKFLKIPTLIREKKKDFFNKIR
jgi:hypothetical protein